MKKELEKLLLETQDELKNSDEIKDLLYVNFVKGAIHAFKVAIALCESEEVVIHDVKEFYE